MTTAQQKRLYFPAWGQCAQANGWLMVRGRLWVNLDQQREKIESEWEGPGKNMGLQVIKAAADFAGTHHRAVVADDLRHACNFLAAQKLSSGRLSNKEVTRVVQLFALLTDPWDPQAVMDWLNPGESDRRSFIAFLLSCGHEAAIIAISVNAFGTRDWTGLTIERLRWICKQIKERPLGAGRKRDPELEPF